jgi:hypothetical protein
MFLIRLICTYRRTQLPSRREMSRRVCFHLRRRPRWNHHPLRLRRRDPKSTTPGLHPRRTLRMFLRHDLDRSVYLPYYINPAKLNWGANYAWLWFPSNLFMEIFVFFFIPETKDRTLEEIDEMFEMNVPEI